MKSKKWKDFIPSEKLLQTGEAIPHSKYDDTHSHLQRDAVEMASKDAFEDKKKNGSDNSHL